MSLVVFNIDCVIIHSPLVEKYPFFSNQILSSEWSIFPDIVYHCAYQAALPSFCRLLLFIKILFCPSNTLSVQHLLEISWWTGTLPLVIFLHYVHPMTLEVKIFHCFGRFSHTKTEYSSTKLENSLWWINPFIPIQPF